MTTEKKSVKSLAAKLAEIVAELGPVEKKSRNPHFGYNYVSEGQMMAELRQRLSTRNIFMLTSVEACSWNIGEAKLGVFVMVQTKHKFIDADSGDSLEFGGAGVGWDSGDKGVYKAITGATKYALMKNFLVTDEQDPEAGEQRGVVTGKHKPTKAYEQETAEGDAKAMSDLLQLSAWLKEHDIPEGFVVAMLKEKKMVPPNLTKLASAPPGVLRRTLASRERLLKAFEASNAAVNGERQKPKPKKASKDDAASPTSMELREPVQDDISPEDLFAQEDIDDWREVVIHFGKQKGAQLGKVGAKSLVWWIQHWIPEQYKGNWDEKDVLLDAALCLAHREIAAAKERNETA